MSVNDPTLRDLKVCIQKLWNEHEQFGKITDSSKNLVNFLQKLEIIFYNGMERTEKFIFFKNDLEPITWMIDITKNKSISFGFSYLNSVENVQNNKCLTTKIGKFRLLIKYCLNGKCLHIPVEYLQKFGNKNIYYKRATVLGDEILTEIFYSLLLQCSNFKFDLDLSNFFFLDTHWDLPDVLRFELIPSESLGLAVSFSDEKAVVVEINPFGPAGDDGRIEVGDILESINDIRIDHSCKNKLDQMMKNNRGSPLKITVIKALKADTGYLLYPPLRRYLLDVYLDILAIQNAKNEILIEKNVEKCNINGFKCVYVGCTRLGDEFEAKQVDKTIINIMKYRFHSNGTFPCTRYNERVVLSIGELGLVVYEDDKILFEHSYAQISSCNSSKIYSNFFGYIKRNEENEGDTSQFTCYIFYTKNREEMMIILSSIGEGFKRTHYAV